jgi:arabinose-5-phosphate isomerase
MIDPPGATQHSSPVDLPVPAESHLSVARRVLSLEAEALSLLTDALDHRFEAAVEALAGATGRVVVSGMGKSGHVGRKIAATMASTGTPAMFVHPGEASHGDLGMILAGDVVLALSNSGETQELSDLVAHTRRFGLTLVAIIGRAESSLARDADVALVLPAAAEACPMGLAPTTSTTMQMALGDALAVALLTRRGFTPADFRMFHPGGKLGAQLMRVEQLMHSDMPLAAPAMRMDQALVAMTAGRFGCLGIVEEGRLAGIITDGDLRRALKSGGDLLARDAASVMTRGVRTARPDMLAAEALRLMNERSITALFVVDAQGAPVGILHIHDLLRIGVA